MRISDWSSDVCSSDLRLDLAQAPFGLVDMRVAGMYEKPGVGIPCEYFPVQIVRLAGFTLLGPADVRVVGHHGEAQFERSEEHTSELQSLMRISYAVFCLKKKNTQNNTHYHMQKLDN